jgi:hypothetical protein
MGNKSQRKIDRAGVRPFPLHNQPTDHFMKTIAVKQKALDMWESTGRCGKRDWMASFLDFEIDSLEERCAGIAAELSEINRDPIWN